MKTLYLARHGEAVKVGYGNVTHDFDRNLTVEGIFKLETELLGLQAVGARFEQCFASPLLRAQQTAKILTSESECEPEALNALGSEPSFSVIHRALETCEAEHVLMVGHAPFISQLTAYFLNGSPHGNFHFSPGTVACIQVRNLTAEPQGELQWLMGYEILSQLAQNAAKS